MRRNKRVCGFALYEVLIGLAIFVVGVLALGRAVENCLNASELNAEEARVRQLLSNEMAEVQAAPVVPEEKKETKIDTGYGVVRLLQRAQPENLKNDDNTLINGITRVTLTAEWSREGVKQSKQLVFYVYRTG
jgi:Tfp pilus assembly protein PilV